MKNKYASLTPQQLAVLRDKATDLPHSGVYEQCLTAGTYLCRGCGHALFRAGQQFLSSCGWPSFDDEIVHAIKQQPDSDGRRTEILCMHCDSHLGHIFHGEGLTVRNNRYCVNASAIDYVENSEVIQSEEIILAAGCFWGVEYLLEQKAGILKVEVGYTGGTELNPDYQKVCQGQTGHVEAVRVVFDPSKISCDALIQYYFEIHDPTQLGGQGPDIGPQYLSIIFYYTAAQQQIALHMKNELQKRNYAVVTEIRRVSVFWPAEEYHQHYYSKTGKLPYCHAYRKKF